MVSWFGYNLHSKGHHRRALELTTYSRRLLAYTSKIAKEFTSFFLLGLPLGSRSSGAIYAYVKPWLPCALLVSAVDVDKVIDDDFPLRHAKLSPGYKSESSENASKWRYFEMLSGEKMRDLPVNLPNKDRQALMHGLLMGHFRNRRRHRITESIHRTLFSSLSWGFTSWRRP